MVDPSAVDEKEIARLRTALHTFDEEVSDNERLASASAEAGRIVLRELAKPALAALAEDRKAIHGDWFAAMGKVKAAGLAYIAALAALRAVEDRDGAAKDAETRWFERTNVPGSSREKLEPGGVNVFVGEDPATFERRLAESVDRTRLADAYFESATPEELEKRLRSEGFAFNPVDNQWQPKR